MASKTLLAILAVTALAACGQPTVPAPASAPPEMTAATPAAIVTPEIAAQIAALPGPYNTGDYVNGRRLFNQCR